MKGYKQGVGPALSLGDLESRYRRSVAGAFSFLFDSCCIIDTQPPLPPGAGG